MDYASLYTSSFSGEEQDLRLRVERRLSASPFLAKPLRRLGYNSAEEWAWDEYKSTVLAMVEECRECGRHIGGAVRLMEIGGGRSPLLTPAEAGIELIVNDIDAGELARAPEVFEKAQFDIAGEIQALGKAASISPSREWCSSMFATHHAAGPTSCACWRRAASHSRSIRRSTRRLSSSTT